jgi:hypothetical protein
MVGAKGDFGMRLPAKRIMAMVLAAMLPACGLVQPVDPEDAAERAVAGAALGTALGVGLGATFAINPGVGSIIGAETGAALGAATGVITAAPVPGYKPIPVPTATVIPGFYDGWPPGYYKLPGNPETQEPPSG